jgi:hypothetical protein
LLWPDDRPAESIAPADAGAKFDNSTPNDNWLEPTGDDQLLEEGSAADGPMSPPADTPALESDTLERPVATDAVDAPHAANAPHAADGPPGGTDAASPTAIDTGIQSDPPNGQSAPRQQRGTPVPAQPFSAPSLLMHGADDVRTEPESDSPREDPHAALYAQNCYPSARDCAVCHQKIYDEWSVSSHAYAAISPMFQRFEQTITNLTQGTIGYFCMRCHAPVATAMATGRDESILAQIPAAQEGITCIVCHRVRQDYGKVNAERRIEPGSIFAPVYGAGDGSQLQQMLAEQDHWKIKSDPLDSGPGQAIHNRVIHFEQISHSEFCVSCHQVAVYPGIALEIVWNQYRASPAAKEGITCQDCHMGQVPGEAQGYATAPVAIVADRPVQPGRKHANHIFYGPGYSIAHPGLFPFRAKPSDWTAEQWLQFDWRAGWGTESFEAFVAGNAAAYLFPEAWAEADDRRDGRERIEENLQRLQQKRSLRMELMERTSRVRGPLFSSTPRTKRPLRFEYVITNLNPGHNMPSGSLGAQPQLWLNVVLTGPRGEHLWESGHLDSNGDLADIHSLDVAGGRIAVDQQLTNFQTKFLTTNVKGTDREMYLPINVDIDQLPFIRPAGLPVSVLNHPPLIRLENHSIPPLGSHTAKFRVPAHLLQQPGRYRLSSRMRFRVEPIYFMRFCQSTPEMERSMLEGTLDFHAQSFEFEVR